MHERRHKSLLNFATVFVPCQVASIENDATADD